MDLVRTIEDEELPDALEEEEEDEEVDSGFSFSFGKTETPSAWDFKTAKKSLREFDESKSVDSKITRRLEKNEIKKQKAEQKKKEKQNKQNKNKEIVDSDDEFAVEEEEEPEEEQEENVEEESNGKHAPAEDVVTEVSKSQKQKKKKSKQTKEEEEEDEESRKTKEKPEMEISFQWDELQLSRPILKAVQQLDYKKPTPVQSQCIPLILGGYDICGSAVTGSGKTAAFVIPILQRLLFRDKHNLAIRVLILSPTRELAVQCQSVIEKLAKFTDIRAVLSVGGLNAVQQETALRSFPDIVVATPGRLIDHVRNAKGVSLDDVEIFIMDEADRLLEMGFSAEIEEIMKFLPTQRQTLLFSATMTEEVNKLAKLSMKKPIRISVNPSFTTASTLSQEFIKLKGEREASREAMLIALCKRTVTSKAVIFCRNKFQAHRLKILFGLCKLNAAELHGNLTQNQRLDSLERFREGKADYLLATDLAARGLDILGVETVVNFEMPMSLTDYIHRVGRTARAGERGKAISFAADKDKKLVKQVLDKAQDKVKQRILPVDEVAKCRNEIESLENDVQIILRQERVETELRKAELEQRKAENMMKFETEIYSKPKKTWFQTVKEKAANKERAKEAELGIKPVTVEEPKLTKKQEREQKIKQKQREASKPRNVRRNKKFEKTDTDEAKFVRGLSKNRLKKRKRDQDESGPAKKRKGIPGVSSIEDELRGSSVSGSRGLVKQMQRYDKRKEKSQKKGQKALAKRMAKGQAGKKRRS